LFNTPHKIPHSNKITTLSPQNAIVYSYSSVPHFVVHLVVEVYDSSYLDTQIKFPSSLTTLTFQSPVHKESQEYKITNEFVNSLPPTLKHLTTEPCFNQPVNKLPPTLTHLTTGYYFNQPIGKQLDLHLIYQLTNFHLPSLTSQLDIISTKQSINFHQHSLTSQLDIISTN
jgi:hypothetical protein